MAAAPLTWRTGLAAASVVIVAAGAAWLGSRWAVQRTVGAAIPAPPDLTAAPSAVREAIGEALEAARAAPGPVSIGALGESYHGAQLPSAALAAYAVAARLDADGWRWQYLRAVVLDEHGDPAADEVLRAVADRTPALGHAWYRLGERLFKRGDLEAADAAYARAASAPATAPYEPPGVTGRRTRPLAHYAALGRARVAVERGSPETARRLLADVLASDPAFGPARSLLRQVDAGAPAPTSAPAHTSAPAPASGPAQTASSQTGATAPYVPPADPVVDRVVAASRHSDVLLKHAGQAVRAGDAAWREFLVRRAATYNPDDLNVLMDLAALLGETGRPAEALEVLRRHETLAPGDHHTLVQQGRVLADLGRLDEAEAVLRRAVRVRDAAAEFNLGTVLDAKGRWDDARARYERALAIDPFHTRAMNNLAAGLDRQGQTDAALDWFARAIAITPDAADLRVNRGAALLRAGRFSEAGAALREAVALAPSSADAHNNLGIALAQQGDLEGAVAALERAVALDARHRDARRNLEQVTAARARRAPTP